MPRVVPHAKRPGSRSTTLKRHLAEELQAEGRRNVQNLTNLIRKAAALLVPTVLVCLVWAGGVVASSAPPAVTSAPTQPHIMVIVEENTEYGGIIGSSNAPYINSLATTYASAASWFAVQHNSLNDYLELLSGSNQGLPSVGPYSATTLVDELHTNGIPWRAYMESMPLTNCYPGGATANGLYNPMHNPFRYFTNYNSNQAAGWCSSANLSTEGVVPYLGSGAMVSALNGANAPDFVWITPNDCHNMHGDTNAGSTCAGSTASQLTQAGDTWLSSNIGPVISSPWFSQNGVIIITWDEGTSGLGCCGLTAPGGHIATVVVTPNNKGLGKFTSSGDHYGTLAAIEKAYGVTPLVNSASSVNGDLSGAFGQPVGGSISGTVTDTATSAAISGATVSDGTGGSITSNGSGYTLNNVAPGTYTVTASATGYATQSAPTVTVTAGATTTQNFALVPLPGTISGKVSDFVTRVGISGATVSYTGPGGSSGNTTTAGDGTYSLNTLPEGSYTVIATATGYNSQTDAVGVAPGATATQNFTLPQSGTHIPCTGVGTTVSPPSTATAGAPVTITASAAGCPSPLYQFWMLAPDHSWQVARPYSPNGTFSWDTTLAVGGVYQFSIWTRDSSSVGVSGDSLGRWDAYSAVTYDLTPTPCTSVAVSPSPPNTALSGTVVTITGTGAGCPHPNYQFWILAPGGSWRLSQPYSTVAYLTWDTTGLPAGTYNFSVWARDQSSMAAAGGTSGNTLGRWDAYQAFQFVLTTAPCTSVSVTTSPPSTALHGTLVTITGTASGCPSPLYRFWMLSPGSSTWKPVQDYSSGSAAYAWDTTGLAVGTYNFSVWTRDKSSTGRFGNSLGTWDAYSAIGYRLS
jgi:phosphatidylinositol-3-phosphatase